MTRPVVATVVPRRSSVSRRRARSSRERVGRETAVEQLGQQAAEIVAVAEQIQVGIAAAKASVIPPGGDGLPQGPDRLVGQVPPPRSRAARQ